LRDGLDRAASRMAVISQDWSDAMLVLGATNIMVRACLGLWGLLAGRQFVKKNPERRFKAG